MENSSDLRLKKLVQNIYELLLGGEEKISVKNSSIIKVNNGNLSTHGDLNFPTSLDTWRKLIPNNFESISRFKNILEYFLIRNKIEFNDDNEEFKKKAFRNIIEASNYWYFEIERCMLRDERVCIFLNREKSFKDVVCRIVRNNISYGEFEPNKNESFYFHIVFDDKSELTNLRLRLIKGVAENIIRAHGYEILDNIDSNKYDITVKSERKSGSYGKTLLCGVVSNPETKKKETLMTELEYLNTKLTEHELLSSDRQIGEQNSVDRKIAAAAIAMEFLAMKPSRDIKIASVSGDVNDKGASFVLYNTARISAIFEKFEDQCLKQNYPRLPDVDEVDFSLLDQEEEWELLYNYLLGYPEMIKSCARLEEDLEICPQYICSFLYRFCNKFSAYYRRVRILTEGREHLLPTMMARLYLLKAVQIVICNALRLLNIDPVSRM